MASSSADDALLPSAVDGATAVANQTDHDADTLLGVEAAVPAAGQPSATKAAKQEEALLASLAGALLKYDYIDQPFAAPTEPEGHKATPPRSRWTTTKLPAGMLRTADLLEESDALDTPYGQKFGALIRERARGDAARAPSTKAVQDAKLETLLQTIAARVEAGEATMEVAWDELLHASERSRDAAGITPAAYEKSCDAVDLDLLAALQQHLAAPGGAPYPVPERPGAAWP